MIKLGDTIGIIALAGACDSIKIEQAKANIEKLGYKVKLSKNIFNKDMYLAGSDEDRLEALYDFFKDDEIKLILNARGGYGSIRLINKIDYDYIKNYPKYFCGFSDITALNLMFYKRANLKTYHGPMAMPDFSEVFCYKNFENMIDVINGKDFEIIADKIYKLGYAKGVLWGGNLSTVVSLCGQDFIPNDDFIFFTEDLNENTYKIDKMFTQLFNIEKFKTHCKGIILGEFLNTDNYDWLERIFDLFTVPTLSCSKITHNLEKITLQIGKLCYIEGNKFRM